MTAKVYHLVSHDGAIRPGKATTDQIAAAINPNLQSFEDRLATVEIVDGHIKVTPLPPVEIERLRGELADLRRAELLELLDATLRVRRLTENHEGIAYGAMIIWVDRNPHAEDIVRDWAAENGLVVRDDPPPSTGKTWIRTMDVRLNERSWSGHVVELQWPSQPLGDLAVARDAELDNRTAAAEAIRAEMAF